MPGQALDLVAPGGDGGRVTLEAAGVMFIEENGEGLGAANEASKAKGYLK